LLGVVLGLLAVHFELFAQHLVARSLPRLRQQDQRRGVRSLGREGQVEEDERVRVPVRHERDRVERDPGDDDERLPDDVSRRSEEARGSFCSTTEGILTEGAVLGHQSRE